MSFVAATQGGGTGATVSVNKPAGVQSGDFLLMFVTHTLYANGVTTPTGWTLLRSDNNYQAAGMQQYVFYKFAGASEPASYSLSIASNTTEATAITLAAYRGIVSASPVDVSGFNQQDTSSSAAFAPAVTTTKPGTLVRFWEHDNGTLPAAPTPTVQRINGTPSASIAHVLADEPAAAPGSWPFRRIDGVATGSYESGYSINLVLANQPPNAPSWVTPQNSTIPADADAYLEIAFSDPDPGDSMSASNWKRWTLDSNGNRVAGSEVDTYQGTPSTKLLLPAGTLASGTKYEFQADTLDSQGAEGPYSASLFITAQNTPAQPTWTDPISGQTIGTSSYTGVISDPTVDSSEWTLYADDGAGNIDTSTVLQGPVTVSTGDVRRHTFSGLANGVPVWWSARVKYQGLWSQPNQIRTPVSYTPPAAPQVTLTPDVTNGALVVGITNPAPGAGVPATSYNNIYVDDGKGAGKERVATMLPTNQPWTYPTPVSLRDYAGNLWVEAVATNGVTAQTTA